MNVNKVSKEGYTVEHIVYESQPGFYVTSSLFIPDGLKQGSKAPAVIYCLGALSHGETLPSPPPRCTACSRLGFFPGAAPRAGSRRRHTD